MKKKSLKKITGLAIGMLLFITTASSAATVEGTISYRERIRLLPGAVLKVSIVEKRSDGQSSTPVAEIMRRTNRQVPIPFSLEYEPEMLKPESSYYLDATLTTRDRQTRWHISRPLEIERIKHDEPEVFNLFLKSAITSEEPVFDRVLYRFNGLSFNVVFQENTATLELPEKSIKLPIVISASGSKYSDGDTTFWTKRDEALLEMKFGKALRAGNMSDFPKTQKSPYFENSFEAKGNEPGWLMKIHKDREIFLEWDYGKKQKLFAAPRVYERQSGKSVIYTARADSYNLRVTIKKEPCTDDMSGKPFDYSVEIKLNERIFRGCGDELDH